MDDSDDDDVPITELIRRKQAPAQLAAQKNAVAANTNPVAKKPVTKIKREQEPEIKKKPSKDSLKTEAKKRKRRISTEDDEDDDEDNENGDDDDGDDEDKSSDDGENVDEEVARGRPKKLKGEFLPTVRSNNMDKDNFYSCVKGRLVQKLLVRWWYAIEWPKENELRPPQRGFEPLEGFKGVDVSTRQDTLGAIDDRRDRDTCPNLTNLRKKSSEELKELCEKAYNEQLRQLVEAEGSGTKLELLLRNELREISRTDCRAADIEAAKIRSK